MTDGQAGKQVTDDSYTNSHTKFEPSACPQLSFSVLVQSAILYQQEDNLKLEPVQTVHHKNTDTGQKFSCCLLSAGIR